MTNVTLILVLMLLLAAGWFGLKTWKPRRKHRSQFFSHTFDNSGQGRVPEPEHRDLDNPDG